MKYLDDMMQHIDSEYESHQFLKTEVLELATKNFQLERDLAMVSRHFDSMCQKAYDFGYDAGSHGTKFDRNFIPNRKKGPHEN